jgi:Tfp pilus assembly protein PilF
MSTIDDFEHIDELQRQNNQLRAYIRAALIYLETESYEDAATTLEEALE